MSEQKANASRPAEPRGWLVMLFWTLVATAWSLVVGLLALVGYWFWASQDRDWAAERVAKGMTRAEVLERVGVPTEEYADAEPWRSLIKEADGCKSEELFAVWRYSPFFKNDALVFFDRAERVACLHSTGLIFDIRS